MNSYQGRRNQRGKCRVSGLPQQIFGHQLTLFQERGTWIIPKYFNTPLIHALGFQTFLRCCLCRAQPQQQEWPCKKSYLQIEIYREVKIYDIFQWLWLCFKNISLKVSWFQKDILVSTHPPKKRTREFVKAVKNEFVLLFLENSRIPKVLSKLSEL